MFKKILAAVAAMLAAAGIYASGISVRWELPTTNIDGSEIPATGPGSIASTTIEYGPCTSTGAVPADPSSMVVQAPSTTATLIGLIPGREYCVRAFVTNTYGEKSGYSNTVKKQSPVPIPKAPVLR